jgi:hypothetical protein
MYSNVNTFSINTFNSFKTTPEHDKKEYNEMVSELAGNYFTKTNSETQEEVNQTKAQKVAIVKKYKNTTNSLIKNDLEQSPTASIAEKYNKYLLRLLALLPNNKHKALEKLILTHITDKFDKVSILLPLDLLKCSEEQRANKMAEELAIINEMINIGKNVIRIFINNTKQLNSESLIDNIAQQSQDELEQLEKEISKINDDDLKKGLESLHLTITSWCDSIELKKTLQIVLATLLNPAQLPQQSK